MQRLENVFYAHLVEENGRTTQNESWVGRSRKEGIFVLDSVAVMTC